MDYTKYPRQLIYHNRRSLEDFGIYGDHKLNIGIAKTLRQFSFISGRDAELNALACMNTAYYICTMALLEKDPTWRISEYERISEYALVNNRQEAGPLIITLVFIYLCSLPKGIGSHLIDFLDELRKIIKDFGYYNYIDDNIDLDFELPPNEFAPCVIDRDAIRDMEYPGFQWYHITGFKVETMREVIETFGKTEEEKYLIIDSFKRSASWKSVFDKDSEYPPGLSKTFDAFMMEFCPNYWNNEKNDADLLLSKEETKPSSDSNTNKDKRIAELEEEVTLLKQELNNRDNEAKKETLDFLEEWQKRSTRELAIFFSQALGVSFNPKLINQSQLANLAAKWTEPQPDTIRTKIGKLYKEESTVNDNTSEGFSKKTKDEALNVYYYIIRIAKYYSSITPQMNTMLDNINLIYGLNIDEAKKKLIFESIDEARKNG